MRAKPESFHICVLIPKVHYICQIWIFQQQCKWKELFDIEVSIETAGFMYYIGLFVQPLPLLKNEGTANSLNIYTRL